MEREERLVRDVVRLNPKETQRAELCCHSVIMLSLFYEDATHWSDRIVRLSFISNSSFVMTALPF